MHIGAYETFILVDQSVGVFFLRWNLFLLPGDLEPAELQRQVPLPCKSVLHGQLRQKW